MISKTIHPEFRKQYLRAKVDLTDRITRSAYYKSCGVLPWEQLQKWNEWNAGLYGALLANFEELSELKRKERKCRKRQRAQRRALNQRSTPSLTLR